jgi:hypothetical protein
MASTKSKRRWPSIDPSTRFKPPTRADLEKTIGKLRAELRAHQTVLTVLCVRDGRLRVTAQEVRDLGGYDHRLNLRGEEGGGIVVEHDCVQRKQTA